MSALEGGRDKWAVQEGNAWQVVSIEGFASATNNEDFRAVLLNLIHGKTEEEINQALFNSPELRAYGDEYTKTVNLQIQRQLLPGLEAAGIISKNTEGVWSR